MRTDFPTYSTIQVINLIEASESFYELSLILYRIRDEEECYDMGDLERIVDAIGCHSTLLSGLRILRRI